MMDDGSGREPYPGPPVARSGWVLPSEVAPSPAPGYAYVGFWRRFWAYLVDMIILAIPTFAAFFVVAVGPLASSTYRLFSITRPFIRDPATGLLVANPASAVYLNVAIQEMIGWIAFATLLVYLMQMLYFAIFWSRRGATPGQMLLGVEIRSEADGARIGFARACLRYLGYLVSAIVLYIGFIWVAFDDRKRGWHDMVAGTVAVRRTG